MARYAQTTNSKTRDGLRVYNLDPLASELWAVAGPDGVDPKTIDPDDLPEGFRWVDEAEWEEIDKAGLALYDAVLAACEELDPEHQGEQWPDPIAWDGRPLKEIATDLLTRLLARREQSVEDTTTEAEEALRQALTGEEAARG